jgi:hypothetical protein
VVIDLRIIAPRANARLVLFEDVSMARMSGDEVVSCSCKLVLPRQRKLVA